MVDSGDFEVAGAVRVCERHAQDRAVRQEGGALVPRVLHQDSSHAPTRNDQRPLRIEGCETAKGVEHPGPECGIGLAARRSFAGRERWLGRLDAPAVPFAEPSLDQARVHADLEAEPGVQDLGGLDRARQGRDEYDTRCHTEAAQDQSRRSSLFATELRQASVAFSARTHAVTIRGGLSMADEEEAALRSIVAHRGTAPSSASRRRDESGLRR